MTVVCEKLQVFADGELPLDEVSTFERHFAGCAACQAELQDLLLLESLAQGIRPPLALPALERVPPFAARRRSRRTALGLAAMAGISALMAGALLARRILGARHPDPLRR
jgi:anti-sigma factor RsiW